MKETKTIVRVLPLLLFSFQLYSQTAAKQGKHELPARSARDQRAIEEAKNGWWSASMKDHEQRIAWWREAKFGMLIHWGIYSVAGGEWKGKSVSGYAEDLMRNESISREEYLQMAKQFNPTKFNPDAWVASAKNAGMKYLIVTAKHHDGFAMFNTKVSVFNVEAQTPFRRDPIAALAVACKQQGMKFGLYYSHAVDWDHPDAPGNDWERNNPGGNKLTGGANWYDSNPELLAKATKYVNEKAIPQITELLKTYDPDIIWFDMEQKLPISENLRILEAIRMIDSNVVVNGRLAAITSSNFGDYQNTVDHQAEFFPVVGDWEIIATTNESYGYNRFDNTHKAASHFIRLLATAVSKGGNLLMNIGPKSDGSIDTKDLSIIEGVGNWMQKNKESISATKSRLPPQSWGVTTAQNNKLYLHVFNWPHDGKLYVGGLKTPVNKAYLLETPSANITARRAGDKDVLLLVPKKATDTVNTVIVLELKSAIDTDSIRFISPNIPATRLLAYEARQHGTGFSFGDGKMNRYFVEGWNSRAQALSWTIRTGEDHMYRIVIKYVGGKTSSGEFQLKLDDAYEFGYTINPGDESRVVEKELAELTITQGTHTISLKPTEIKGEELMKILEIQLIPIDN